MRIAPMEVTLRLSERQWRLLADARDRVDPGLTLESFVARAVGEAAPAPRPVTAAPELRTERLAGEVVPGAATALELQRGDVVRIEQLAGGQCVDLVAWSLADARERLSAGRTRTIAGVSPGVGDTLSSGAPNERPMLAVIADSAPGHDLLFPACSPREYAVAGCLPEPSCAGVQAASAAAYGLEMADLPDPLNLWLRAEVEADGSLGWQSTPTVAGDHVELLALVPVLVIVNPCVDDVFGCSSFEPRPVLVSSRRATPDEAAAWLDQPPARPSASPGRERPLERIGEPPPAEPITWRDLVVSLPDAQSAAVARAAAVRYSLAALAAAR
jgi:uncharacterized protein YcgI (DUF1989 family)